MPKVLLLTPPFTQLNTPYPATAYLKGFLKSISIDAVQADLGIELIDRLFSKQGLKILFSQVQIDDQASENALRILGMKEDYLDTIDIVIDFLRQPDVVKAQMIAHTLLLPEAQRFQQLEEMDWAFGNMGLLDRAKHLCTLYLEDLSDFITECIDPYFGFSRYAERLGRSAFEFDELYAKLQEPLSFIEEGLTGLMGEWMQRHQPDLVAISIPFPGNLLAALRIGQWLKQHYPKVVVSWGGGFVNTELRQLSDPRVFEFTDYLTLDDGEQPLRCLLEFLFGKRDKSELKRTFLLDEKVNYYNGAKEKDFAQQELTCPDYTDIAWNKYLSVIEVANPMFRLWSDGRWVKLTMAHGCYWGKCAFCDGSLDYIGRYDPNQVTTLVDHMEQVIADTGQRGFHFVDEAAPPIMMRDLALEIIRRRLKVVWWTNVRFEKRFTADVCRLLKLSGCIAVAGGLEVASPRVLKLINKGVSLEQVANVTRHFTQAGIMVHAYLMYGFPTQTAQETIDSLEVVRQLFELGLVDSGFWHQFALTAHSPVGKEPERYHVNIIKGLDGRFACNDLEFTEANGVIHAQFGDGLKKALYNYMHGICFDYHLAEWFDFKVPCTSIPPNYIENCLDEVQAMKLNQQLVWTGRVTRVEDYQRKKAKRTTNMKRITLSNVQWQGEINVKEGLGQWLLELLSSITVDKITGYTIDALESDFTSHQLGDFDRFISSYTFSQLREAGLLVL